MLPPLRPCPSDRGVLDEHRSVDHEPKGQIRPQSLAGLRPGVQRVVDRDPALARGFRWSRGCLAASLAGGSSRLIGGGGGFPGAPLGRRDICGAWLLGRGLPRQRCVRAVGRGHRLLALMPGRVLRWRRDRPQSGCLVWPDQQHGAGRMIHDEAGVAAEAFGSEAAAVFTVDCQVLSVSHTTTGCGVMAAILARGSSRAIGRRWRW